MGKKNAGIFIRVESETAEKIKNRAKLKNVSVSKYIVSLVEKDMIADISDDSLFVYHINGLKKLIEKSFNTLNTFAIMFTNFLILYFCYYPEESDEKIRRTVRARGKERFERFQESVRTNLLKNNISYLESIFGEMLEEDDVFNKYKQLKHKDNEEEPGKSK